MTKNNAISGGEINNIQNGVNGIICEDDPRDLERVLRGIIDKPEVARKLGVRPIIIIHRKPRSKICFPVSKAIAYGRS